MTTVRVKEPSGMNPRELAPGTIYLDDEDDIMIRTDEDSMVSLTDGTMVDDFDNYTVIRIFYTVEVS